MNKLDITGESIPDSLVAKVRARLAEGKRVRRTLPGGRLHIDRPLPFLCVYREPKGDDAGTRDLVVGEASFLFAPADERLHKRLTKLIDAIVSDMSERFGAFLIIEVWSAPDKEVAEAVEESAIEPTELRPTFMIGARGPNTPLRAVEALRANLTRVSYLRQKASCVVSYTADGHPPGLPPLLPSARYKKLSCQTIGLAVRPIYRDADSHEVFPDVIRSLRRGVGRALKQAFFTFAKTCTNATPQHYFSLGRRAMVKAVWEVDRRLAKISDSFDFLLQVTPVNAEAAWHEFRRSKFDKIPRFYYRPLAVEPAMLKRQLYEVPIERIEDPTLAHLFRQRQDELDRKITMLSDVGTPRFLMGSLQVYGSPRGQEMSMATDLLARIPPQTRDDSAGGYIDANAFAAQAQEEIEYYRSQHADFRGRAIIRDDMFSGLLCTGGDLLIGKSTRIPARRAHALLQHEVGTHLLTYYNGRATPFQQLHSGFAGYDALQEGLAVLSEYLVDGLSRPRMRLLAARVVAAAQVVSGATFVETFRLLDRHYSFSQRVAYTITMRTYRGGGLTKDMVYLSGLVEILSYLGNGGDLDPLWLGKIAVEHIPLIRELRLRQVLPAPPLRPRYLEDARFAERLESIRRGLSVQELVEGKKR
ncbi:MAG: DUF1704 domain-containing protein [Planctomycetota bacterium]|nr:MAG: DUF1704 domain-containing protein [Planctomycetota bacterium]REJ90907.1 MAG: DUF1704 domain-containing protein [Planctomycetota bacterium]REK17684.1 MAG: DUF1704 domain-containing protein [Planctomycetota bacterium]REK46737.1 MAG: DUF1704 domain-containing protein [Planctomycetota bacterium]